MFRKPPSPFSQRELHLQPSLLNSLYDPFGSPCRGQKPQKEGCNRPTRCSEPLRSKVGGPKRSSPYCAGWDRLG